MTRKISFLTLFFIVLGAVLSVAIAMRVRSYQAAEELPSTLRGEEPAVSSEENGGAQGRPAVVVSNGGVAQADGPPAPASAPSTDTRLEQIAREREQRYNELLRAGAPAPGDPRITGQRPGSTGGAMPPSPAPATPVKEPSLLKRVASALGIGRSDPVPVSQPVRPTQQQPQQPQSQKPREDPTEPPDPESDVTAPQLMTIEFVPPQVKDGETTQLITTVTDDLSGVATVSGVIASPTGGLQGFACQREGETNRYLAQIKVPADAAEGLWRVNYLTLADNARNSINLAAAQGMLPPSASFRVVSSNSDSTGPTLKAVWLDRIAMRAGERNVLFVQAEDEKSGVQVVSGVLLSPSKNARIGFGCQLNGQGVWECPVTPPTCLDCGLWSLEQIQIQDKASNMMTFRGDNPMVKQVHLDIAGEQCDSQPPQLSSVTLEPLVVSNAEANTIVARAIVTDDICGVANLSGQAAGPGTGPTAPRLYFSFERQGDQWIARISVPKHAARGIWKLVWIQVLDAGHNLKAYSERDPALQGVTFRVQ